MSVEFNIYVLARHPNQDEVLSALGGLGLSAHFLVSWESLEIQAPGSVAPGVIAGVQLSDRSRTSSALKQRDRLTLEALYSKEALALVTISIDTGFTLTSVLDEEFKQAGATWSVRASLRQASARITLQTTARANDF